MHKDSFLISWNKLLNISLLCFRRYNSVPSFWFRVPNCQGDHKRRRSRASPFRWYQKRQKPWRLEMVEIKINWYSQVSAVKGRSNNTSPNDTRGRERVNQSFTRYLKKHYFPFGAINSLEKYYYLENDECCVT